VRSRRRLLLLALPAVLAFGAVSFLLARWLSTETRERNAVLALLEDQARGDAGAMLGRLDGCAGDAACRATVRRNAGRLRRPGTLKILAYSSGTSYALGGAQGETRVAWTVLERGLPVVQCVTVRREGSVLAGRTISLRRLSAPIGREGSC